MICLCVAATVAYTVAATVAYTVAATVAYTVAVTVAVTSYIISHTIGILPKMKTCLRLPRMPQNAF